MNERIREQAVNLLRELTGQTFQTIETPEGIVFCTQDLTDRINTALERLDEPVMDEQSPHPHPAETRPPYNDNEVPENDFVGPRFRDDYASFIISGVTIPPTSYITPFSGTIADEYVVVEEKKEEPTITTMKDTKRLPRRINI